MQLNAAVIREQGQTFAIVIVKSFVLSSHDRDKVASSYSQYFPNMPIILMAQDSKGTPTYYGRKDIVNFLKNVHLSRIPWKRYNIS